MVEKIISVFIFAMFMGLFLLGFYIYTKIVEKRIKKELETKTEEVVREIYSKFGNITKDICERVLRERGIEIEEAKKIMELVEEKQKTSQGTDIIYKGERFH